jgi:5-oxoprolinase (ATP-hydrolysing) subunit C
MTALVVVTADPATSVQDGGRQGAQRFGLPPSGAMDRTALAVANTLVGNAPFAAAIEIGPFGAGFKPHDGAVRVALAGAMRAASCGGERVAFVRTFIITGGETLTLGPARDGVFSYLAIEGGLHGDPVFGSLSVTSRAGIGSPFPRNLRAGDSVPIGEIHPRANERSCAPLPLATGPIRVIAGPQDDEFDPGSMALLLESEWSVAAASDRMGYRLEGPALHHMRGHNIVSDGLVTGSIQVPGSGQPIVMMPDRGTTGGYPKIATVVSVDIGRLAQTRPGTRIRFAAITVAQAQELARQRAAEVRALPSRLADVGDLALDVAALQGANIAGVAVSAIDAATWQSAQQSTSTQGPGE